MKSQCSYAYVCLAEKLDAGADYGRVPERMLTLQACVDNAMVDLQELTLCFNAHFFLLPLANYF